MSDEEFIAYMAGKSAADRAVLFICDIAVHCKSAQRGKCSWDFEREYLKLKSYMKMYRWDKEFILAKFGISFQEMAKTYFSVVNS